MTVETETILIKLLEELKAESKEIKESLTKIQITLAEVKVEGLNTKKDVEELKADLKGRISIQTYWFLVLISLLVGIVGKFAFFPNP